MFDDEDDENGEKYLKQDLDEFESHLKGKEIGFMDSDRIEAIIDHFLINGNYSKAKAATELALIHFSYNYLFHLRVSKRK